MRRRTVSRIPWWKSLIDRCSKQNACVEVFTFQLHDPLSRSLSRARARSHSLSPSDTLSVHTGT